MVWPRPRDVESYIRQDKLRILHYGLGPLGAEVARLVASHHDLEVIGAIDARAGLFGRDLGEAAAIGRNLGIPVSYDPSALLNDFYADVVIHTSDESLTQVYPELLNILNAEKNVIATCPELVYPGYQLGEIGRRLDQTAREKGVRILGVGFDPGLALLSTAILLAIGSQRLQSVHIERAFDPAERDLEAQRRAGLGLTPAGFEKAMSSGDLGSRGLEEAAALIAETLGWQLERIVASAEPVLARERLRTEFYSVDRGDVAGMRQSVRGIAAGREVIQIDVEASLQPKQRRDLVHIEGTPSLEIAVPGGLGGLEAAAAAIVNTLPTVADQRMPVGLISIKDLPLTPYLKPSQRRREEPL
ncbi:MAG TPA: hypothetical protein VFB90_09110 [Dehalococcoidia bacterium]|nr:hypothetical protein [Dehalococcoidia bacterium]